MEFLLNLFFLEGVYNILVSKIFDLYESLCTRVRFWDKTTFFRSIQIKSVCMYKFLVCVVMFSRGEHDFL